MRMTIRFHNGRRAEALLLSAEGHQARVLVKERGETEEWLMIDGHFYDESGRPVEVDAFFAVSAEQDATDRPKTMTAGCS